MVAGGAVSLSLPPFGYWVLAPVGLAVLYVRLRGLSPSNRALSGFVVGLALYGVSLWWVSSFNGAGYVALVILSSAITALASLATPRWGGRVLAFPAAFTLAEALRASWPLGGLPLAGLSLGQAGSPLLGTARLGGWLLVAACACLAGAGLGEAAMAVRRQSGSPRGGHLVAATLAVTAVVAAAVTGSLAPDGGGGMGQLRVAAVQGGGQRGLRAVEVDPSIPYQAQIRASQALHPGLQLVVWPEDVIKLSGPLAGSDQETQVGRVARSAGATLVAGVTEDVGSTQFRNQAVAWGPGGSVVSVYDKVHRVPFGEYVPWRSLFKHLASLSDVSRDAIAGHGPSILRTPAGPLAVMVSYEVFFSDIARSGLRAGGQLMVVPTNTSSYSTGQVPAQELAAARLRAVEGGRDLVQAAPTGYSAIIDNRGRVLMRSSLGTEEVVSGRTWLRSGVTYYMKAGEWPLLALAGLALIGGWLGSGRLSRRPAVRLSQGGGR